MRLAVALALAPLALTTPALAQATWTVDDDGPADFSDVQLAVDGAAPGDVILVAQGTYGTLDVDKGVSILLATGATLIHQTGTPFTAGTPTVRVHDLPAQQSFTLSSGQVFNDRFSTAAILVEDCAGAVWFQEVFVDSYGAACLRVRNSTSVLALDTFFQTNAAPVLPDGTSPGLPGAFIEDGARLFSHESRFAGSHNALVLGGPPQLTFLVELVGASDPIGLEE